MDIPPSTLRPSVDLYQTTGSSPPAPDPHWESRLFDELTMSGAEWDFKRAIRFEPLVEGTAIARHGWGLLHGHSGAGKSFMAMGLAIAVATGTEWLGRKVEQGPVLYVYNEGMVEDFHVREEAHIRARGLTREDLEEFDLSTFRVNLSDPASCATLVRNAQRRREGKRPYLLIVVDTLHRASNGGETNEDWRPIIQNVETIIIPGLIDPDTINSEMINGQGKGPCVTLVHHNGIGADRERGGGALNAAVDFNLSMEWDKKTKRPRINLGKNRNGEEQEVELRYDKVTVPWGGKDVETIVWHHIGTFGTVRDEDEVWLEVFDKESPTGKGLSLAATIREIGEYTGTEPSEYQVRQWRARMIQAGKLTDEPTPRRINEAS